MNKLCDKCTRDCKQPDNTIILECKKFKQKPVQMEFRFKKPKK